MTGGQHSPAAAQGYQPVLDGLRALAVTAVIAEHAGFGGQGFHGVTVFFVISGYLITRLLIGEFDRTGSISFRRFYWRRLIRLGPALVVAVLATLVFLALIDQPVRTYWAGPIGALTYSMDLVQAIAGNGAVGVHFQWSWSLGVEEQFYLLWPVGLLLLWRRHRRLIVPMMVAVIASAWIVRAAQNAGGASHASVFFGPASHYDALVLGVLVAVFRAQHTLTRPAEAGVAAAGLLGGVGLVLLEFHRLTLPGVRVLDPNAFGLTALSATAVVLWASGRPGPVSTAVLGNPPLALVGRLSYGLYLWNMLTVQVFLHLTGHRPAELHKGILWAAALFLVALASYFLVEQPLRRRWSAPAFLAPGRKTARVRTATSG